MSGPKLEDVFKSEVGWNIFLGSEEVQQTWREETAKRSDLENWRDYLSGKPLARRPITGYPSREELESVGYLFG